MSGDSDFTPLLRRLRAQDRRTAVEARASIVKAYRTAASGSGLITPLYAYDALPDRETLLTAMTTAECDRVPAAGLAPALLDDWAGDDDRTRLHQGKEADTAIVYDPLAEALTAPASAS